MRRVDSCITWPGTVYSFSFTFTPDALRKKTGIMSKKRVRSSLVSSVMSRPRTLGSILPCKRVQVGRLPGQRRAVVDDLQRDLARFIVECDHPTSLGGVYPSILGEIQPGSTKTTHQEARALLVRAVLLAAATTPRSSHQRCAAATERRSGAAAAWRGRRGRSPSSRAGGRAPRRARGPAGCG